MAVSVPLRAVATPTRGPSAPIGFAGDRAWIDQRWELIERLDARHSSSRYRARDGARGAEVALELLAPGVDGASEREARILARIKHPNLAQVVAHGEAKGHRFIVTDEAGRSFGDWLAESPPTEAIVDRFVEAGRGLAHVHRYGMAHRNFGLDVISIVDGRAVIAGLAMAQLLGDRPLSSARPHVATATATDHFAPERIVGRHADARADQFSFCLAMWRALTGERAFAGDLLEHSASVRRGPRTRPSGVSAPVVDALLRGLSFDPEDRFESMDALLDAIERPARPRRAQVSAGQRWLWTALALAIALASATALASSML